MPSMIDHNEGQKKRKAKLLEWRGNETIEVGVHHMNLWNMNEGILDAFEVKVCTVLTL